MKKNRFEWFIAFLLATALSSSLVFAEPTFQVNSFSCSPSEAVINSVFSCTAQVYNSGTAGILSTATLYPDAANWLESSNYPQSYGSSIGAGESASITFTGLRAIKSGNNGFSKIMLDPVTDNYVATNNEKINIINVAVTVSNSDSSAAMSQQVTATTEVTSGGNTDVTLTFAASSGGCSIGSQTNPKTISGMTDGSKQSRTWTITQGTSGDCQFTISAAATGVGGIASKIDSTSSAITCADCPTGGGTDSSTSGAGGGAGAAAKKTYLLGELTSTSNLIEFSQNEKISFNISGESHLITLTNSSETTATITIESKKQTFKLTVGDEIKVDVNEDNSADISIKLKSVNIITKKVSLIISRISGGAPSIGSGELTEAKDNEEESKSPFFGQTGNRFILWGALIFFIILTAAFLIYYLRKKRKRTLWGRI